MPMSHQIKFELDTETELSAGLCPVSGKNDLIIYEAGKAGLQS